ncbi:MAG: protein kinase, partial [Actinomycetia bacterium]|nr:protein kinase [Actinomycetes bacterium]
MTITISNYHIEEELSRSSRTIIYRAWRDSDNTRVIIKTLNNDYPSNHDLTRFKHEFHMIKKMAGAAGVVQMHEQIKYGNNLALVLEDFKGISLHDYLAQTDPDLEHLLRIAIDISRGLGSIHRQNMIHKDINPSNIL